MRILTARGSGPGLDGGKEDSAVHDSELNYSATGDGSHDQDALDMRKLGLQQQTKVSKLRFLLSILNIADSVDRGGSVWSQCSASPPP